jgi:DNA-binding NtrC family response regulator
MKKVLIIDDDERIRRIIKIQLHKSGLTLFEAENKDTAFTILEKESVDVIICDLKMKDTSGFTLLEEIIEKYNQIPVIMLTGFIDKNISERAKRIGSFDFITKPVRREKLIETIYRAIEKKGD